MADKQLIRYEATIQHYPSGGPVLIDVDREPYEHGEWTIFKRGNETVAQVKTSYLISLVKHEGSSAHNNVS